MYKDTTYIRLPPIVYTQICYISQEHKTQQSLFWFGLGVNIFFGNVVAITQQEIYIE